MEQKKEIMLFTKQLQSQAADLNARERVSTQESSRLVRADTVGYSNIVMLQTQQWG